MTAIYLTALERLASRMRLAGIHGWTYDDMRDLCEQANLFDEWVRTTYGSLEETEVVLQAAEKLNVKIWDEN